MTFDYKTYYQHCVVCNRAKPDRRGGASLQPLRIPKYPWGIDGIDYVTNLPKRHTYGYTTVLLWFVT
jgi:hypothetical protein